MSYLPEVFRQDEEHDNANLDPIKPIWSLNLKDEKDVLQWTKKTYNYLVKNSEDRMQDLIRNIYLVKGVQLRTQDRNGNYTDRNGRKVNDKTNKINMNKLLNFVNSRAARLSRFPVSVAPIPHDHGHSDNEGARAVKSLIDTFEYKFNLRALKSRADKKAAIEGEAVALVTWCKDKGSPTKRWKAAEEELEAKKGKVEIDGEEYSFDPKNPELIGDIDIKILNNWEIGYEPGKAEESQIEWVMTWGFEHVEKLQRDYPKFKQKIKPAKDAVQFNLDLSEEILAQHALVIEVWGRSTKYLPEGVYWKATEEVILESPQENPYPDEQSQPFGNIPIVRLKDLEVEGEFYGHPTVSVLAPTQYTLNQLYNMIKKSAILAGHPKIAVPKQAKMKTEALGNDMTIFTYQAPFKPEPMQSPQVSADSYNFISLLDQEFDQTSGQNALSKGQLPSNIRSGRQIRLLEEVESLQASETVAKSETFIVNIYRKMLTIASKFYQEDEERLVQIIGKDKSYRIEALKRSALDKPYDIRVLPSTSLPQTPAARIAAVAELFQIPEFNTLLPREQWADMLDLGTPGKFYDAATAGIVKAEMENEEIIDGKEPKGVDDGDHHISHWKTHNILVESPMFLTFSERMQDVLRTHIMVHEMKMMDKAAQNPAFAQALLTLPLFPKYFIPLPVQPTTLTNLVQQNQAKEQGGVPQQGSGNLTTDVQLDSPPEGVQA